MITSLLPGLYRFHHSVSRPPDPTPQEKWHSTPHPFIAGIGALAKEVELDSPSTPLAEILVSLEISDFVQKVVEVKFPLEDFCLGSGVGRRYVEEVDYTLKFFLETSLNSFTFQTELESAKR